MSTPGNQDVLSSISLIWGMSFLLFS